MSNMRGDSKRVLFNSVIGRGFGSTPGAAARASPELMGRWSARGSSFGVALGAVAAHPCQHGEDAAVVLRGRL